MGRQLTDRDKELVDMLTDDQIKKMKPVLRWPPKKTGTDSKSALLAGSATDSGEARDFLIDVMENEFTDKSFTKYIEKQLAGDFACEIAATLRRLYLKLEE